jgi:hypothetical protein
MAINNPAILQPMIDESIATNPDWVDKYRGGKKAVYGFFVGQVMKASKGQADPTLLIALVMKTLDALGPLPKTKKAPRHKKAHLSKQISVTKSKVRSYQVMMEMLRSYTSEHPDDAAAAALELERSNQLQTLICTHNALEDRKASKEEIMKLSSNEFMEKVYGPLKD